MMVAPGPNFSVADVFRGWSRALDELGCIVREVDLAARLTYHERALQQAGVESAPGEVARLAAEGIQVGAYQLQPDIVVICSGFFVPPAVIELLRIRGAKVVMLFTESPYEDDSQLNFAPLVDLCVLNDPTNIGRFLERNPNTIYLPHAYDPKVHFPREADPDLACDFAFVGTGYPSRMEFFEAVDWTGIDATFGGNWQELSDDSPLLPFLAHERGLCMENSDAADLYASTKVSANLYRTEAQRPELSDGWAMGPREVELAAVGCFYMTEPRGENREVLPMVPTFDGPGDFEEQLRWWLARPTQRADVIKRAREAIEPRTFRNHAAQMLRTLYP